MAASRASGRSRAAAMQGNSGQAAASFPARRPPETNKSPGGAPYTGQRKKHTEKRGAMAMGPALHNRPGAGYERSKSWKAVPRARRARSTSSKPCA